MLITGFVHASWGQIPDPLVNTLMYSWVGYLSVFEFVFIYGV